MLIKDLEMTLYWKNEYYENWITFCGGDNLNRALKHMTSYIFFSKWEIVDENFKLVARGATYKGV